MKLQSKIRRMTTTIMNMAWVSCKDCGHFEVTTCLLVEKNQPKKKNSKILITHIMSNRIYSPLNLRFPTLTKYNLPLLVFYLNINKSFFIFKPIVNDKISIWDSNQILKTTRRWGLEMRTLRQFTRSGLSERLNINPFISHTNHLFILLLNVIRFGICCCDVLVKGSFR